MRMEMAVMYGKPRPVCCAHRGLCLICSTADMSEPYDPLQDVKDAGIRADLRAAESATNWEPTKAQIQAGNYKKGTVTWQGMEVRIENPRYSVRTGTTKEGKPWRTVMKNAYGHLSTRYGRSAADGDGVDVFIGDHPDSALVGVVDQYIGGKWDEHKAVLGCVDAADAERTYLANYQKGWDGCGAVTLLTAEQFKSWVLHGDTGKPIKGQKFEDFHKAALDLSEEKRKPVGYDATGNMICGDGSIFATREEMEAVRRPTGARLEPTPAGAAPGITVEAGASKAAKDKNPYQSKCPGCDEPAVGRCRCRGPHSLEDLKKGHGLECPNGHRWSGDLFYNPAADPGAEKSQQLARQAAGREQVMRETPPVIKDAADRKEVYAVDLDGTLAQHDPDAPFKIGEVGPPVKKMLARVKRWIADGKKVVIFTARASREENLPPIKAWLKEHGLPDLKITNEKTPDITRIYDDRSWQVERNTGEIKQARFFTYDECRAEGEKAIANGELVRVLLHDPDKEHTYCTLTGVNVEGGETPLQAALRTAKDLEGVTLDESSVEGMPKDEKGIPGFRVLLPAGRHPEEKVSPAPGAIKDAAGRTRFNRPENFDLLKEHSTEKLKVEAGCNDWESAWTGITFTFPNLGRQVWAHLSPPASWIDSATPSKDQPTRQEVHDWQDKLVKGWLSAAKELARQEEATLHPEHFLQAAKDTEIKRWIESVGENRMKWDPVKQASVAPPAQPEVQTVLPPRTGPEAILHALQNLDLEKLRADSMDVVHRKLKSKRPAAVQILGYLEGLKRAEIQPHQLMITRVPVLPPHFRPFTAAGETFIPGDANELYRDLVNVRSVYEQMRERLGEEGARPARLNLYDAMSAVYGFGEPVSPKTRERGVTGFLKTLTGTSPKFSVVQRNLLSKDVDYVGRGTVGVDPELGMDEIGIPDEMAWKLYAPFIQRRLVRAGMSPEQAVKQIKDRTKEAERMLDGEMGERPVMYSRAPAWHKFNFVAGRPKRRPGNTIMTNPFITTGMNLDYDGDCGRFVLRIKRNMETVGAMISPTTELKLSEQVIHIDQMPRIEDTKVEKSERVTEWDVPAGTQLYALDLKTGQHAWADVTKVSLHRTLVAHTVQLACGEALVVSEDHSIITYNPATGALEKTKPAESIGQFVPRATRMSTAKPIEQVTASREGHEWKLKLTRDVGVFLGLLAGDGCLMGDRHLALNGTGFKVENRAKFTQVAQSDALPYGRHVSEIAFTSPSLGGGEGLRERSVVSNTAWFSRWLQDHIGHGALNKRVPAFSLQAGPAHLMGVLDGLLSSDGSVSISHGKEKPQLMVNFSTSSPDLGLSIQEICRLLGVATGCTPYKSKTSGRDAWIITLSTVGLKALVEQHQFTLTHPEKNRILQENVGSVSTLRGGDVVPYPLHLHKLMQAAHVDHTGGKKKPNGKTDFGSLDQWKMKGVWSRGAALQWMDAYLKTTTGSMNPEPFLQYRVLMSDRSLAWERVEKADRMNDPMDMWDVTIPGPFTFATSSGLFVQDTVAVHLPIMDATVGDAKTKLMPSKMLFSPKDRDKIVPGLKQEQILGLHNAQARPALNKHVFPDERTAMAAIRSGKVRMSDEVEIGGPV